MTTDPGRPPGAKSRRRWCVTVVAASATVLAAAVVAASHVSPLSTHRLRTPLNSGAAIAYASMPGGRDLFYLLTPASGQRSHAVAGGALLQIGLSALSIGFLRQALDADPSNMTIRAALGEALVLAHNGQVVPAAKHEFDEVLASAPNDLIARFYVGYWLLQNGKPKPALVKWVGLMRTVGADSLWYDKLWAAMPLAADQVGVSRLALQALCTAGM
jgi:hypothetical protein